MYSPMSTFNTLSAQNYYKYDKSEEFQIRNALLLWVVLLLELRSVDYSDTGERADALKDEGGKKHKQLLYILRIKATIFYITSRHEANAPSVGYPVVHTKR